MTFRLVHNADLLNRFAPVWQRHTMCLGEEEVYFVGP